MKCKQCNDVSTLAQKYSPVFKTTAVNSENLRKTNIVGRSVQSLRVLSDLQIKNI